MNISEVKNNLDFNRFCNGSTCQHCIIRKIRTTEDCSWQNVPQILKDIIKYNRKQKLAKLLEQECV